MRKKRIKCVALVNVSCGDSILVRPGADKDPIEISQRSEPLTDPHQSVILQYGALAARVE